MVLEKHSANSIWECRRDEGAERASKVVISVCSGGLGTLVG